MMYTNKIKEFQRKINELEDILEEKTQKYQIEVKKNQVQQDQMKAMKNERDVMNF